MQTFSLRTRGVPALARISVSRRIPARPLTRLLAVIAASLGLVAEAAATQVTLSWQDNSTNESGFQIERSGDATLFTPLTSVAANIVSFADTAVLPATTYWYRVRAYNAAGSSPYSNIVSVTTGAVAPANTAPTIGAIADRTISEDGTTGAIAFSVGDAETAAGSLLVSATSSNLALVPNPNLVLGGTGASRTLAITPANNQNGTTSITVAATDGALTTTRTFIVTVAAVNDIPTVSTIANQTINAGTTTGSLAFTVADVETAAGSLTVTASSSNGTLVPASSLTLGGSGAGRTLTVAPVAGQSGTATITVAVSDGAASASSAFVLTVLAVNTAPTISAMTSVSIPEDATTGALAFTVGDTETAAGSLVVTASSSNSALVPTSAIALGGSGANRTVTVTPAANQNGAATITLTVSDGALTSTRSFGVTVTAVNDLPTISAIADQTIAQGGTVAPISFTIGDVETPATSLTLSAASSNLALVPVSSITFAGSGSSRTLSVAPVTTLSGSATITINVSDGVAVVGRTFTLTVTSAVAIKLVGADIGSPALSGSTTLSNGSYTIRAGGSDIWGRKDQFHFASQPVTGDAELTVRVASITRAHAWSKAGLMFRGALTADAPFVGVYVTPDNGVVLQWRSTKGGNAQGAAALSGAAPEWLKLVRTGDSFYAFRSEDGTTWELVEFVTVNLPDVAYGGLAVTSHNTKTRTTATFDHLEID